ncbi:hypothetical protein [Caballeronia sp. dw_19]|nr:hypothetical protein [Caballeronia sp. dw_19]
MSGVIEGCLRSWQEEFSKALSAFQRSAMQSGTTGFVYRMLG